MNTGIFNSFFLGGFECSTHRLPSGRRLDLIGSTRHDELARADYELLQQHGIATARDGLRWHLIERSPHRYDFSSADHMLDAARSTGMQVIWDLWHYGWPDDLDIFSAAFVERFARFAGEALKRISDRVDAPYVAPINEISFFSWAGGEGGVLNPFARQRGHEMKRQLVRASIAAIAAMRAVNPAVRLFQVDPIINVVPHSTRAEDVAQAEGYRRSQFEAWDMLSGRAQPELGGSPDLLDVIGVNYYIHNQWIWQGAMLVPSDPRYGHVGAMLQEVHARYRRPLFIAETGIEDDARPAWLRYMCRETFAALAAGVPIEGLCLYPILNHPGWDDDRHCHNGLFDYARPDGSRPVFEPLAAELVRQRSNVAAVEEGRMRPDEIGDLDTHALDWAAHVMKDRTDEGRT